jgi:hypothetical protein
LRILLFLIAKAHDMSTPRHTFVRFVTANIDEDSGKRRGIFQAAGDLMDGNELPAHDRSELQTLWNWFCKHLDEPDRFARSQRRSAAPKAISWFKSTATEYISRMHSICRILNEHGIATEMITTTRPGYIVFGDDHQIAAVPFAETDT